MACRVAVAGNGRESGERLVLTGRGYESVDMVATLVKEYAQFLFRRRLIHD